MEKIPAGWTDFQPEAADDGPPATAEVSLAGTAFVFSEDILENNLDTFFCAASENLKTADASGSGASVAAEPSYGFRYRFEAISETEARNGHPAPRDVQQRRGGPGGGAGAPGCGEPCAAREAEEGAAPQGQAQGLLPGADRASLGGVPHRRSRSRRPALRQYVRVA